MKIAILSCNTGGGHNAAAAALAEELSARGHESRTYNTLDFLPKGAADLISRGHDFAYRYAPKLYGAGYRMEEKRPSPLLYEKSIRGIGPLYEALVDLGADAAICVHVFPAMMMTELRRQHETGPVFCFVATDYTCSPTVGGCTPDICVIPHEELAEEFVSCGIARETLLAAGIPVRAVFRERGDRAAARSELALPPEGRHIVLMSGSIGCGPMADIAAELERRMERGDFASVLCGSNRQMLCALRRRGFRRVEAVGFTNRVHRYMDSADVLVSKPGGISITEAGTRGTPLLLADMVGGCETRNQEFFHARGWAETCQPEDMADAALALLDRPERRQALVAQQHRDFDGLAADRVAQAVYDRCRGGEAAKA